MSFKEAVSLLEIPEKKFKEMKNTLSGIINNELKGEKNIFN